MRRQSHGGDRARGGHLKPATGADGFTRRRRVAAALRVHREAIAKTVTEEFLRRHPDWVERYGDLARIRGEEDAVFHVQFLEGAILSNQESAFAEYARWTAGVLGARGIAPTFLAENLEQVGRAAERALDESDRPVVRRMVAAGVAALSDAPRAHTDADEGEAALAVERRLYTQAILAGERRAALTVTTEALRAGASVPDVYRLVLQPAQYELGRLWESGEITVAKEHMSTAITQYVVAQLYGHLEVPPPVRGNALITGVQGELHQIGANMVADVLEADGWRMRFLGTQMPHGGVLDAIEEHRPKLLGISATVLSSLPAVADLIDAARRGYGSGVAILVGGGAFRASPEAWRDLGADGFGRDLSEAVVVAARLDSSQS